MMRRFLLVLLFLVGMTASATAGGPMTLTSDGHLFKVWSSVDGLILSHLGPNDFAEESVIPQSVSVPLETVKVIVDELTMTVYVVWSDELHGVSKVRLAIHADETWFGPLTIGGLDGTGARNPEALIHRAHSVIDDGSPEPEVIETTFLHLVWWRHDITDGLGHAIYLALPLEEDGLPDFNGVQPIDLKDLLPFGIGCNEAPDVNGLAYPQFFIGADGLPLLFTTDFGNCVFHILGIDYEVEEFEIPGTGIKRRRQIAVFRAGGEVMAIPPGLILTDAKMLLGQDFTVLIYWDVEGGVEWVLSKTESWSDVKRLPIGSGVSHEQAVELIRELVNN